MKRLRATPHVCSMLYFRNKAPARMRLFHRTYLPCRIRISRAGCVSPAREIAQGSVAGSDSCGEHRLP
eukprot:3932814-Rhodomonas_salina.1